MVKHREVLGVGGMLALQAAAGNRAVAGLVQAKRDRSGGVAAAAARGVSGPGGQIPFNRIIQKAFGKHDVSSVQAHAHEPARWAARTIGARAYATGNHVAFGDTPDLHTAAHEAAHVVQQRGGVQLGGGVGEAGDAYEQHADQVADLVVQGRSAEALLDEHARPGGAMAIGGVQRVVAQGLAPGTPILWNGQHGVILQEAVGQGYLVRVRTNAQPPLMFQSARPVPYARLDPGQPNNGVPFNNAVVTQPAVAQPAVAQPQHQGPDDGAVDEAEEEAFDGMISSLPESVTVDGITYGWHESGNNFLLKPTDGRNYPHLTFIGNTNLGAVHFTSASYVSESNKVSVIRRGYRWNGGHNRFEADPHFSGAEQFLDPKSNVGGMVTFDLSGGRRNQRVAAGAAHVARPSFAALAAALNIPT
jgi:hypothetical protein